MEKQKWFGTLARHSQSMTWQSKNMRHLCQSRTSSSISTMKKATQGEGCTTQLSSLMSASCALTTPLNGAQLATIRVVTAATSLKHAHAQLCVQMNLNSQKSSTCFVQTSSVAYLLEPSYHLGLAKRNFMRTLRESSKKVTYVPIKCLSQRKLIWMIWCTCGLNIFIMQKPLWSKVIVY